MSQEEIPSQELQDFTINYSKKLMAALKPERQQTPPSGSPAAEKIKIDVGISFKPLTIHVTVTF